MPKNDRDEAKRMAVVVTTYKSPRELELVLAALSRQSYRPDEIVVADDGSGEETRALLQRASRELELPLIHAWQPDRGFRLSRSRNNALLQVNSPFVAFLDQDVLPHREWMAVHRAHVAKGRVCIGSVLDIDEKAAGEVLLGQVLDGSFESLHLAEEFTELGRSQCKYSAYAWLRRAGLGLKSKPKTRGNNLSMSMDDLREVNGFDEEYVGWGQEDDDLGKRLYRTGVMPVVVVDRAIASHLGHAERRAGSWKEGPNVRRFIRKDLPDRCVLGLQGPDRSEVVVQSCP